MKRVFLYLTIAATSSVIASAGVSYNFFFGVLRDASGGNGNPGVPLPNSTVVVLVADTDGNNGLPGGVNGSDLTQSGLDPATAFADFNKVTLSVGQLTNSGDQIFYVGQIDGTFGDGTLNAPKGADYPGSYPPGLAGGQNFGLYWFPGVTATGTTLGDQPFDMGGFFNPDPNTSQSTRGMVLDSDTSGAVHDIYQVDSATAAAYGETSPITEVAFSAVTVPEPSALLLGVLGGLALLRRRRS
jgi:MYXO-CTERM domain-containing protein